MKKIRLFGLIAGFLVGAATTSAQNWHQTFQLTPFSETRFFGWKEFSPNGTQLLAESGLQASFGVNPRVAFGSSKRWFVEGNFEYYFGTVDYEGHLQDGQGNLTPFNTIVGYTGFELMSQAGYVFGLARDFELVPSAGFGLERWTRVLDKGGRFGYTEVYNVPMFTVGVEGTFFVGRNVQLAPWFGVRVPFSISESIDLSQSGLRGPADLSLSPGITPRFRFGAKASIYRVLISVSYETWTLTQSNSDRGFHQPESTRKIFSIRAGYTI